MNPLRKNYITAIAVLAASAFLAIAAAFARRGSRSWAFPDKSHHAAKSARRPRLHPAMADPGADPVNGLTDNVVQAMVKKEYFPDQFTVIPKDGDKVTVDGKELTWHAVDTKLYNVNLYHFGTLSASRRPTCSSGWSPP